MGEQETGGLVAQLHRVQGERAREQRLFRALNAAATAMWRAADELSAVRSVADALFAELGLLTTAFEVAGTELVLRYHTIASQHVEHLEGLIGLDSHRFRMPIARVTVLQRAVESRRPLFEHTSIATEQTFGALGVSEYSGPVVALLEVDYLVALPIALGDEVPWLLVVLGKAVTLEDREPLDAFALQLAATMEAIRLREAQRQSLAELRSAQEQLVRAQRLEAMGRVATGMAHDLNNVLAPAALIAEWLAREPALSAYAEDLGMITSATRAASETTRRLLAFARQRGGAAPAVIDIRAAVADAAGFGRQVTGAATQVKTVLPAEPVWMRVNASELVQVLLNLILNSHEAMPGGGTIALEVQPAADEVFISCRDNGTGMATDVVERAAEPFFTTKDAGTGLGLSMAHGMARQNDGALYILSEIGAGTVVTLCFPRATAPITPDVVPNLASQRLLLVEDWDDVAAATIRMLQLEGHQVCRVSRLQDAAALLDEVDAVICDVDLPDGQGWELLHCGRPVVFVTGKPMDPPEGAVVVAKPYEIDTLTMALASVLSA